MSAAIALLREGLQDPAIRAEILSIVRDALKAENDATEPLIDAVEAAKILGTTAPAVRAAAYRRTLPCVRVGRSLRFRRSEILGSARR